jgi:hypothetical protein
MPGLVPGIHVVLCLALDEDVDGRAKASGSDAVLRTAKAGHDSDHGIAQLSHSDTEPAKILFTMFVDWIFTSFVGRLFTNVFSATARSNATACLYRACHAD